MALTNEQMQQITDRLRERQANENCPRCRHNQFAVVQGIHLLTLSDTTEYISVGGPFIPLAAVVCVRCGWTALHALTVLNVDVSGGQNE